jgi:hypothetical protein
MVGWLRRGGVALPSAEAAAGQVSLVSGAQSAQAERVDQIDLAGVAASDTKVPFTPVFREIIDEYSLNSAMVDLSRVKDSGGKFFKLDNALLKDANKGKLALRLRGAEAYSQNGQHHYLDLLLIIKGWKKLDKAKEHYIRPALNAAGQFSILPVGYDKVKVEFGFYQNSAKVAKGSTAYQKGSTNKLVDGSANYSFVFNILDLDDGQGVEVANATTLGQGRIKVSTYGSSIVSLSKQGDLKVGESATATGKDKTALEPSDKRGALRLELTGVNRFSALFKHKPGDTDTNGKGPLFAFGGDASVGYDPAIATVKLEAASADATVSDHNDNYRLAGSRFALYRGLEEAKANAVKGRLQVLLCDDQGQASCALPNSGSYYLTSLWAGDGYERSPQVFRIETKLPGSGADNDADYIVKPKLQPRVGRLEVELGSALPDLSDGHALYDLSGSRFALYDSKAHAQVGAALGRSAELVCGTQQSDGVARASLGGIPLDSDGQSDGWWLRQSSAGPGFLASDVVWPVAWSAPHFAVVVQLDDQPVLGRGPLQLHKSDQDLLSQAQKGKAQAGARLVGAEYRVDYFDQYEPPTGPELEQGQANPLRTWYLRCDAQGQAQLDTSHLIEGSARLYRDASGTACLPLGSLTLREELPSPGYDLDQTLHRLSLNVPALARPLQVDSAEPIQRGDMVVQASEQPILPGTNQPSPELKPLAGVTFDFFASRDCEEDRPRAGRGPAFSLTSDAKGLASSEREGLYLVQEVAGSYSQRALSASERAAGLRGIPFDRYLVRARPQTLPAGRQVGDFYMQVAGSSPDERIAYHQVVVDEPAAAVRVLKVDQESGRKIPYPAVFQVIGAADGQVFRAELGGRSLDRFCSDTQGDLLLPVNLPFGSYLLRELEAPSNGYQGYLRQIEDVPFVVDRAAPVDDPICVVIADAPAMGQINLRKLDSASRQPVAGAVYELCAAAAVSTLDGTPRFAADEVVGTLTTDGQGRAQSALLYLGAYRLRELSAPAGYLLSTKDYHCKLVYAGQEVALSQRELALYDHPTKVSIGLRESDLEGRPTERHLPGASFELRDREGHSLASWTTQTAKPFQSLIALSPGDYQIHQTAVPAGHAGLSGPRKLKVRPVAEEQRLLLYNGRLAAAVDDEPEDGMGAFIPGPEQGISGPEPSQPVRFSPGPSAASPELPAVDAAPAPAAFPAWLMPLLLALIALFLLMLWSYSRRARLCFDDDQGRRQVLCRRLIYGRRGRYHINVPAGLDLPGQRAPYLILPGRFERKRGAFEFDVFQRA